MTTEVDPGLMIAFICDDSTHYKKIKRGFDRVKQKFPELGSHMLSCDPMDDKRNPELQMADVLAEVARDAMAKSIGNNMAWTPPYCLRKSAVDFKCWHKSGMLKFLRGEAPGA